MSTRYVWKTGSGGVTYVDEMKNLTDGTEHSWKKFINYIPTGTFSGSVSTTDNPQFYQGYSFDSNTGKYSGSGPSTTLPASLTDMSVGVTIHDRLGNTWNEYPYLISNDGKYIYVYWKLGVYPVPTTSDDVIYWTRFSSGKNSENDYIPSSANGSICIAMLDQDSEKYDYLVLSIAQLSAREIASETSGYVSSNNSNAYPGSDYTYLGSDSIDPLSISYPTTGKKPGDSITVTVTPASNTYGGTISYQYQYNIGSGWVTIQTTTATSIQFDIPSTAKSIQFRVRAQDDWGFISDDYVTGPTVYFDGEVAGRVWVGSGNTARQANGVWVGVNGVAKKITAMWVGVNGIAKKVF